MNMKKRWGKLISLMVMWVLLLFLLISVAAAEAEGGDGRWEVVVENSGVCAMHMALLPSSNKVILISDSTDNTSLPTNSVELDLDTNQVRPLKLETDTWCSSGAMAPDGRLIQTGGANHADRTVREYAGTCAGADWMEIPEGLANGRCYATDHILPDGRIIVVGGRGQFNYEFVPKNQSGLVYKFPLVEDSEDDQSNNLYPFVHLAPDGNLFVFWKFKSILLDYVNNRVVRRYPDMPGYSRNYPTSGSSVLLPLDQGAGDAEVLICGGGAESSYSEATRGNFLTASDTCGRLRFTDPDPHWQMESMPMPRVMGDMLLLPTGDVLILNGASKGSAGWGKAQDPVLYPLLYRPSSPPPLRFQVLTPSATPRLYHSSCHILPDGRVLVGGSNSMDIDYNFTDLSLEAFSPPYLAPEHDAHRPFILSFPSAMGYDRRYTFSFHVESLAAEEKESISVTILAPSFNTHSYSMNQRLLRLQIVEVVRLSKDSYEVTVKAPPNGAFAPPGFYLLFVVQAGIPSAAEWVQLMDEKVIISSNEQTMLAAPPMLLSLIIFLIFLCLCLFLGLCRALLLQ